jgi:hypothetical protein
MADIKEKKDDEKKKSDFRFAPDESYGKTLRRKLKMRYG